MFATYHGNIFFDGTSATPKILLLFTFKPAYMKYIRLLTICILQLSTSMLYPQAGSLDPSFSTNGKVRTPVGNTAIGRVVAIQADQKIVAAGYCEDANANFAFAVVRLMQDGTTDASFGSGGKTIISPGANAVCRSVAIQPDGKIVLAGSIYFNLVPSAMLVRLTADGVLDNTFNSGGLVVVGNFDAYSVGLQSNGKIVVGCNYSTGGYGLFRLKANGTVDNNFGSQGKLIIDGGTIDDQIGGIAIQPDDKIVMAGSDADRFHITTARINSNGVMDPSYGIGGRMPVTVGSLQQCAARGITLQADGKILVVGDYYTNNFLNLTLLVVRLNTNGTLDNNFAGNGKKGVDIEGFVTGEAITVQSNGKIVAIGTCNPGESQFNYKFALCRLDKDGTLDANFSNNGKVTTDWPDNNGKAYGVAIQADGRIVVEGDIEGGFFGTARYLATGSNQANAQSLESEQTITPELTGIRIYPNPAANQLQVSGLTQNGATMLTVMDISGKSLISKKVDAQSNSVIDISQLAPGNYILMVTGNKKQQNIPFIKMP